ncbi:hypothetical protein THOM_0908 [Trachipleistophora hominis]|uniref:Uncharacterized protein n=1 Tax=Trachipleistophora hominis TaxID=72359 RepID=L7JZC6_TRAHO|nr:hypothetical protein THOM_0908 [Trachipleistophora hominis]
MQIDHKHVKEKCERMIMKIENEKEKITGLYYVSKK